MAAPAPAPPLARTAPTRTATILEANELVKQIVAVREESRRAAETEAQLRHNAALESHALEGSIARLRAELAEAKADYADAAARVAAASAPDTPEARQLEALRVENAALEAEVAAWRHRAVEMGQAATGSERARGIGSGAGSGGEAGWRMAIATEEARGSTLRRELDEARDAAIGSLGRPASGVAMDTYGSESSPTRGGEREKILARMRAIDARQAELAAEAERAAGHADEAEALATAERRRLRHRRRSSVSEAISEVLAATREEIEAAQAGLLLHAVHQVDQAAASAAASASATAPAWGSSPVGVGPPLRLSLLDTPGRTVGLTPYNTPDHGGGRVGGSGVAGGVGGVGGGGGGGLGGSSSDNDHLLLDQLSRVRSRIAQLRDSY